MPYRLHREKKVKIEEDKRNVRGVIAKGLGEGVEPMKTTAKKRVPLPI